MDLNLGAFGALTQSTAQVAANSATSQALGGFGLPQELNPFAPAPTTPPTNSAPANPANISQTDAARGERPASGLGAMWAKYQKVILIGTAIALAAWLFLKRRKK